MQRRSRKKLTPESKRICRNNCKQSGRHRLLSTPLNACVITLWVFTLASLSFMAATCFYRDAIVKTNQALHSSMHISDEDTAMSTVRNLCCIWARLVSICHVLCHSSTQQIIEKANKKRWIGPDVQEYTAVGIYVWMFVWSLFVLWNETHQHYGGSSMWSFVWVDVFAVCIENLDTEI